MHAHKTRQTTTAAGVDGNALKVGGGESSIRLYILRPSQPNHDCVNFTHHRHENKKQSIRHVCTFTEHTPNRPGVSGLVGGGGGGGYANEHAQHKKKKNHRYRITRFSARINPNLRVNSLTHALLLLFSSLVLLMLIHFFIYL